MNPKRIIPSIYTSDGQFSQTESRQFVLDYNDAMARAFLLQEQGADEIILIDVTTIAEKRRNLNRFLKDLSKNLSIPFTFGGGIHSVNDVADILKLGVKKVYVNSAAVRDPSLINRITSDYGNESLMVAIDAKQTFGTWKVFLNGGKSRTEIDLLNWIEISQVRGASEILVSTISRNSTESQDIIDILSKVRAICDVPLLASVGARNDEDFINTFQQTGVDGIVSGHFFMTAQHTIVGLKNSLRNAGIQVSENLNIPQVELEEEPENEEINEEIREEEPRTSAKKGGFLSNLLNRKEKEKPSPSEPLEDEEII
jgi:cyclase